MWYNTNMNKTDKISEIINNFIYYGNDFRKPTRLSYEKELDHFLAYFNITKENDGSSLEILTKQDIQNYIKRENISNATKARSLSVIKSFYRYLNKNNIITSNPAYLIKTPIINKDNKEKDIFDNATFLERMEHTKIGKRDTIIFLIIFDLGIAPSKIVTLNMDSFNLYLNELYIDKDHYQVPDRLSKLLINYISDIKENNLLCGDKDPLFYSTHNMRLSVRDINYRFTKYKKMSGNDKVKLYDCVGINKQY